MFPRAFQSTKPIDIALTLSLPDTEDSGALDCYSTSEKATYNTGRRHSFGLDQNCSGLEGELIFLVQPLSKPPQRLSSNLLETSLTFDPPNISRSLIHMNTSRHCIVWLE